MSKKAKSEGPLLTPEGELLPEYDIDYSKAKRNPYYGKIRERTSVQLDPDVAAVFKTPEAVNKALRAFIEAMPHPDEEKVAKAA